MVKPTDKTATKKSSVVKKATAPAPTPTPAPAPAPEPTPAPIEVKSDTNEIIVDAVSVLETRFTALGSKISTIAADIGGLKKEYTEVGRLLAKEMKLARKLAQQKLKRAGNRAPAGFIKPTLVSDELAKFLGKPSGTEMARTAVTKEITSYVKSNNLQDPDNGRTILPDASLAKLLKISKDDTLTYFNLQRYMAPHFPSSASNTAAAAATASTK